MKHFDLPLDSVVVLSLDNAQMSHVPLMRQIITYDLLCWYVELQLPASRSQIRTISKFAKDSQDMKRLVELSEHPVDDDEVDLWEAEVLAKRRTVLDVLKEFKSV